MNMDKQLISARFAKAATGYDEEAMVQRRIAGKMTALIKDHIPAGCTSLYEVGCGTGIFSRLLIRHLNPQTMIMNDICPCMEKNLADIIGEHCIFVPGDAETQPFPERVDLITSCSTIQWFANPGAFFRRCYASLKEEGLLAFSTFGKDNMREVSSITGASLPYHSKLELEKELLSLNYNIIYSGEEIISKPFETPLDVLHHLKRTGVTGIRKQYWTKGALKEFCREYEQRYNNGNTISLTYHPVYIIAKKGYEA